MTEHTPACRDGEIDATCPCEKVPNPGSADAIAQGCTCPVLDNGHGKGIMGGEPKSPSGEPWFVQRADCPLHGAHDWKDRE